MSVAEIKEAIEQLPIRDRLKLMDWLSLELSDADAARLNAWADRERASGRNRVFESAGAYVAHRKSCHARRNAA
jgi:hypothetical protein